MAAISGTAGSVVYGGTGGTAVGNLTEWSIDISLNPVETTAFGITWEQYVTSIKSATGSFSGNFDGADTMQDNLRTAMVDGTSVALALYLNGTNYYDVGTAFLTGHRSSVSMDGKAETTFDFTVSGPVTYN